jgi:uncharacterized membrane protein YgcG
MQGRDGRGNANRGRGRSGRGGRGMARPPPRTGTVAAIGAYLDLVPGKEVNPGVVTNWVNKFREYLPTVCDTPKINLIFGLDATVGSYPVFAEPLLPAADCTRFEAKIWETSYAKYVKDNDKLENDKLQLFGLMLGQMSESSKNRIKETDAGIVAMTQQNPRLLLIAILSTHLTDNRLGAEHNLYKIENAFARYVMEPGDSISFYHQRFRALLSGVEEAYRRANVEIPETMYREVQLGLKFTVGLNSSYSAYKQYYEDGLKGWPESLGEAFSEASKFRPRAGQQTDAAKANAFAMRGRGGSRGRGRGRYPGRGRGGHSGSGESSGVPTGGPSEYGTRKGSCHTCGEEGLYSFECGKNNNNKNIMKMGATSAPSEPSAYGKGK